MTISLAYSKTIGVVNNGFNGRGFANPYDLSISRDERIFVLNRCDPARFTAIRVGICNLDEEYLGEFGKGFGTGDENFGLPSAMAFDHQDNLHITDEYLNRITVWDSQGNFVRKWGNPGNGDGELNGPSGITFDGEGNSYVSDQNNNRVQKFSSDGEMILQWGTFGQNPGQFNLPWRITLDFSGNVYVADWRNDRVQKFSGDGEYLATIGKSGTGDGELNRPSDVAVDKDGNVYISDWGNQRVQVFDRNGCFILKLRGEATLSQWAREFFDANPDEGETRNNAALIPNLPERLRNPDDESSQTEPYFWGPVAVTIDQEGRLYVTEHNRHRFQIYCRV